MTARAATDPRNHQRGGFLLGLIIGLLVGLAIALGVALSVTNVQVPFAKKLPQRTAEQDAAEAQRNQNWNPNAALAGRRPELPKLPEAPTSGSAPGTANPLTAPPYVILPPPDPQAPSSAQAPAANYFVQAGAFRRQDEAEHQRARLNMLDLEARVTTVDQSGQSIYRVRVGPMDKNAAETTRTQLELEGIDASLIFVKPSSTNTTTTNGGNGSSSSRN